MCGRYVSARKKQELLEEFQVELDGAADEELRPDYNVAPTKKVYAVLARPVKAADGAADGPPVRQLRVLRWGLVPSWAKDPSIGSRMINARVETVAEKPSFRQAFARRRCLLPADGYYEWQADGSGRGGRKRPFFIRPADGGVMAMAGLYEFWRDRARPADDPEAWLVTCTVITTAAEHEPARIHDRMPMIVPRERWADWLDPDLTVAEEARRLLAPAPPGTFTLHPVSDLVNSVRNNGPELIRPV